MKKISVIIPAYNVEEYISECLDSVINQTIGLENIEIIVINDGSTDKTLDILNDYKTKYPNALILINQKNNGLSISRNNGIDNSNGKYITFLDSDDYLDKSALEEMYKIAINNKSDVVVARLDGFDSKGHYGYYSDSLIKKYKSFCIKDNVKFVKTISVCSKLYKKSIIKDLRFISKLTHEDIYFTLSIYEKSKIISTIPKFFYNRRYREGEKKSIMQLLSIKTFKDQIINFEHFFNESKDDLFVTFMITNLSNYSISKLKASDKIESKKMIKKELTKFYDNGLFCKLKYYYFMMIFVIYYNCAFAFYKVKEKMK